MSSRKMIQDQKLDKVWNMSNKTVEDGIRITDYLSYSISGKYACTRLQNGHCIVYCRSLILPNSPFL